MFSCCTPLFENIMMSSVGILRRWTLGNRFCIHFCRNISLSHVREKKRWEKSYSLLMARKLKIDGPPSPKQRSQKPHWDYNAEVQAFSSRLNESFFLELLKTAFVNPCYLQAELARRQGLGLDVNTTALHLKDNADLSMKGVGFTSSFLADFCKTSFPKLPSEAVESIISHLTSPVVVAKVARNLSIEDLTMSAHFPVPEEVLHATFMAVVGALLESSGLERAGLFVRDFLATQLIGKDLFDMWNVVNPMGVLAEEFTKLNIPLPEPRLIRSAGASTVLPLYFVGLYSDKKLLTQAPGETIVAAEEEAARVMLRKIYGYIENRTPFNFCRHQLRQPLFQSVSS